MAEEIISNIEEFIRKLLNALNACDANYVLVGGVVAVKYGRPRSTQDCDIVLVLSEDKLETFCDCMGKAGFIVKKHEIKEAFKDKTHFNAYYRGQYGFRADFSWKKGTLGESTFKKARKVDLFGVMANVESPEDLIIAKLIYGSQQDFDDAEAVLRRQKNLDAKYIEKRAEEEGVKKQLKQLLKRVED